jgi:hypothetical protein
MIYVVKMAVVNLYYGKIRGFYADNKKLYGYTIEFEKNNSAETRNNQKY